MNKNKSKLMHLVNNQVLPRERLVKVGPTNLTDEELVAILLRTGTQKENVLVLSEKLIKQKNLAEWSKINLDEWLKIPGINLAKASIIMAAIELGERASSRRKVGPSRITNPNSVLPFLADIRTQKKEHFKALYLNARLQVVHQEILFIGTVNSSLSHPREVFAPALEHRAIAVVLAHNHPSGSTQPSQEDKQVTENLLKAGKLLHITVLDHLIVTKDSLVSMRQLGSINEWSHDHFSAGDSLADQESISDLTSIDVNHSKVIKINHSEINLDNINYQLHPHWL